MRQSILQRLRKLWAHVQYYKYEPSKPSRAKFFRLTLNNQEAWIEKNVSEYDYNLYGDNYLGCSYEIDEDIFQEYLDDRENIDTSGLIARQMPDISDDRINEIYEGAELTDVELESLKSGIADSDESGWKLHSGQYIKIRFGALYALYTGEDMGQGGASFELEHVFANKRLALRYISKKPMIALEKV
ncbi:hypothetical protein OAI58_10300 [Amylibacter sp.]|nr:hypothetical protein [Amylibacter sp.]